MRIRFHNTSNIDEFRGGMKYETEENEKNISHNIIGVRSEGIKKKILCSTNKVELRGHINTLISRSPSHTHTYNVQLNICTSESHNMYTGTRHST